MKLSGISKLKKLIAVISLPFDEDFNKPKLYNEKKNSPQEPHHPFLLYDNTLRRYYVQKGIKNHRIETGEVAQLEQCLPRPHNP